MGRGVGSVRRGVGRVWEGGAQSVCVCVGGGAIVWEGGGWGIRVCRAGGGYQHLWEGGGGGLESGMGGIECGKRGGGELESVGRGHRARELSSWPVELARIPWHHPDPPRGDPHCVCGPCVHDGGRNQAGPACTATSKSRSSSLLLYDHTDRTTATSTFTRLQSSRTWGGSKSVFLFPPPLPPKPLAHCFLVCGSILAVFSLSL